MKRKLELIFLLLAGSVSLFYGLLFHVIVVQEKKQREVSVPVFTMTGIGESISDNHESDHSPPPETSPKSKDGAAADDVNPFESSGNGAAGGKSENPFESPPETAGVSDGPGLAGVKFEKIKEDYDEAITEPESAIVRDVTVGGVMLVADGQLKRTYSGKPPALCPT
jgi:hypothetical protein